ncbi:MAG: tRNA (adenosine(37)-N6)-threonylcarbamoyltransferase complex transferase subunit TsaD [Patescibacteria group bacterium]|jgi:N6-L-threonylcarbamoyladenine synthase
MKILALETSCDETSAAVIKADRGQLEIMSNIVSSQINIHKEYGGVVPEIAARHHIKNVLPVVMEALTKANIKSQDVDLLAAVSGPGLVSSLVVGLETAKGLSLAWHKPLLAVNHMYAHIAANFLDANLSFPAVCLVVSGGHTEIVVLNSYYKYIKIGQTVDDAAGEAFDKVAKLLNLGYPGGPAISRLAEEYGNSKKMYKKIDLPRPMLKSNDFNFSFSGLKTAVLYATQKIRHLDDVFRSAMAYEFQEAAVEVLVSKTIKAAKKYKVKTVMMAGGVAANKRLREELKLQAEKSGLKFTIPEFKLCTDNAAMVGLAAYYLSAKKKVPIENYKRATANPNWELV